MQILSVDEIKNIMQKIEVMSDIESGFVAYSNGLAIIPPVGELHFTNPPGDVHIKYGYLMDDDYYVIKIASGFYDNPKMQLPSCQGLMLIFSQKTGQPICLLQDDGYLTNVRTAIAGAIVAKYCAPTHVTGIGIIGTGIQARLQLDALASVSSCREVLLYGRDKDGLLAFQEEFQRNGYLVTITRDTAELASSCNLIVTTTPSTSPHLWAADIKKGTHITAIGSDTPVKQELDENLFACADHIITDSLSQCQERGDISHALKKAIISLDQVQEIGNVISGKAIGRINDDEITIADLTGLAVQDIQIAKAVFKCNRYPE